MVGKPLQHDNFLALKAEVSALKKTNRHFAYLFKGYLDLEQEINASNIINQSGGEQSLVKLKLARLYLKEQLLDMLKTR